MKTFSLTIMRIPTLFAFSGFCVVASLLGSCKPTSVEVEEIEVQPLPSLSFSPSQGVSAPFAGNFADGSMVVAGGCNFPDKPATEGGAKVFYSDVYRLNAPFDENSEWRVIGNLPKAVAYGASVTTDEGVVCIGGTDGKNSLPNVWLLRMVADSLLIDTLPSLPIGVDNATAAYGDGYMYVAGGQCNASPISKAFRMALPGGKIWEQLPDFVGNVRLQPVSAMCDGKFYLMGGFVPASAAKKGEVNTSGVVYDATTNSWRETAALSIDGDNPVALVGSVGAVAKNGKNLFFMGGVNGSRFEDAINRSVYIDEAKENGNEDEIARLQKEAAEYMFHKPSWYKFNPYIWLYDVENNSWSCVGRNAAFARAGAALVKAGEGWAVINGETMPGIRSADVNMFSW